MEDIEIWMPVVGYEGLYEVSNHGKVKSYLKSPDGLLLKPGRASNGYLTVCLSFNLRRKSHCVQVLVIEAFNCKRPDGMIALHNDGDKGNNTIFNLRWGSYSDNAKDQIKHGTFNFDKGEDHLNAKLTNDEVKDIKRLAISGVKQKDIGKMFGISQRHVSKIKLGLIWNHI